MERNLAEIALHSGPFSIALLLALMIATGLFLVRAVKGSSNTGDRKERLITDLVLFLSVIGFLLVLLAHNIAQAIFGMSTSGAASYRPVTVAVENVFGYGLIGSICIALMAIARVLTSKGK